MSDIPPKQPVSGTAAARMQSAAGLPPLPGDGLAPDIDDTTALVSLHHAASQSGPDSFPVLKAFQEYLESERRRARRRMLAVSALFGGILVVLVAVFLSAGFMVFGYMKTTQEQLWRKLDAQVVPPSVAAPPSATAVTAAEPTGLLAAELNKLSQALAELKRDNARLPAAETPAAAASVVAAATTLPPVPTVPAVPAASTVATATPAPAAPAATAPVVAAPPAPATTAAAPAAPRAAATPAISVPERRPLELPPAGTPPPSPPAGYADSSLYLKAPGLDLPLSWRVLVPAE